MTGDASRSVSSEPLSVTLLGCGKMGAAMLRFWLEKNTISCVRVIDTKPIPDVFHAERRVVYGSLSNIPAAFESDILVAAVKPQDISTALAPIAHKISDTCCVVSIAAGKSLESLSACLRENQPLIRAMPNTPAAVGEGACVAIANDFVSDYQRAQVSALMDALGDLHWIDDERLMNAVTALSGSGPAYVFYLIEALAKAGKDMGLPEGLAMSLARQTVIGSAALAKRDCDIPAARLRENVTSPGGTTQAALDIIMDGRLDALLRDASFAAHKRGEDLNKNSLV
ncbi:MAG: pyrroline-5-carboxylate reductase [Alphaproteobacteria bacterium]